MLRQRLDVPFGYRFREPGAQLCLLGEALAPCETEGYKGRAPDATLWRKMHTSQLHWRSRHPEMNRST